MRWDRPGDASWRSADYLLRHRQQGSEGEQTNQTVGDRQVAGHSTQEEAEGQGARAQLGAASLSNAEPFHLVE